MNQFAQAFKQLQINEPVRPMAEIIAVGSGKGGVGKSFFSSSLAYFLSQFGHDVLLIDLDLGAPNLHTTLGLNPNNKGINEFLLDPNLTLDNVTQATPFHHLRFIGGSSDALDIANINDEQKTRLMSALLQQKARYIILDLSAGTHQSTMDFFLMATRKLMVFTPEPSSVENAYRFMKSAFFRKLKRYEFQLQIQEELNMLQANKASSVIKNPADLLKQVVQKDPILGQRVADAVSQLNFEIVLNQARSHKDSELGVSLQSVTTKYFGVNCNYLGHVDHDNAVWQSLRRKRHMLVESPQSKLYVQLMGITRRLASAPKSR